jgi:hypothetical protein
MLTYSLQVSRFLILWLLYLVVGAQDIVFHAVLHLESCNLFISWNILLADGSVEILLFSLMKKTHYTKKLSWNKMKFKRNKSS